MKYTLCGIEISEEHYNKIMSTCNKIHENIRIDKEKNEAHKFIDDYKYVRTHNSHSTFFGTVSEYIKKFLPEKSYLIKYF